MAVIAALGVLREAPLDRPRLGRDDDGLGPFAECASFEEFRCDLQVARGRMLP